MVIHCMWAYCFSSCVIHVVMNHWEHHNCSHVQTVYYWPHCAVASRVNWVMPVQFMLSLTSVIIVYMIN